MISTVNPDPSTIGTVARKRRRQILTSQRTKSGEEGLVSSPSKKRCIEPITSNTTSSALDDTKRSTTAGTKSKKSQMRYDPDVPMSKEEAAAWRKEQRRKRNRESAAASRQRQRDRISELEQEVSDWKSKYEEALSRIEKLEQRKRGENATVSSIDVDCLAPASSAAVSPCSSPRISPAQMTDQNCGLVSLQDQGDCTEMEGSVSCEEDQAGGNHVKHLSEKISRPA